MMVERSGGGIWSAQDKFIEPVQDINGPIVSFTTIVLDAGGDVSTGIRGCIEP
jgi:hypothetical protein